MWNRPPFDGLAWLGPTDQAYSNAEMNMPTERSEFVTLIPVLRAFARTLSKDGSDADDLVQETLMKGIANINRF